MTKNSKKEQELLTTIKDIQAQLATLDKKFDQFMTKSLTELAEALAANKPAPVRTAPAQHYVHPQPVERSGPGRPMYSVICYECGNDCEIPFKPSGNRPVYCKACFAKRKSQKSNAPIRPTSFASEPKSSKPPKIETSKPEIAAKTVTKKKTAHKKNNTHAKKTTQKKKTPVKKKATEKKAAVKKKAAPKKKTVIKKVVKRKK